MVDVTFLKNDGVFVADDYQSLERASGRLRELANDGKQEIRRNTGNGIGAAPAVEAVLMAAATVEDAAIDIVANNKPSIASSVQKQFDDDLGRNITLYMDLLQGRSQVSANQNRVNLEGISNVSYTSFAFYNSNTTLVDNSAETLLDDTNLGDVLLGVLMHPAEAAFIEAVGSLAATTYSGTGDGTLDKQELFRGSVAETITITASTGGPGATFAVVGSVGGAYGSYTSGSGDAVVGPICINISDGATDFDAADEFTITSVVVA